MRHFGKSVSIAHSTLPVLITATVAGAAVDMRGYESGLVVAEIGAGGNLSSEQILSGSVYLTPSVQESDTTTDGDFVDVAAADLEGGLLPVINAGSKAAKAYATNYIGSKRYIRVKWTCTGSFATTGVVSSAVIVRANARYNPTTQGT